MGNGQSETSQAASSTQTEEKCEEHSLDKGKEKNRNTDYRIKHELEKRTCAAECQTINECSQLNQETGLGQSKGDVPDMGIKSCKNANLKASKRWDSNTGKVSKAVAAGSTIQCAVTDHVEKGRQTTPTAGRGLQGNVADGSSTETSTNNIESCKQSTSNSFLKTSLKGHTEDNLERQKEVLIEKAKEARCSTQHQRRLSNLAPKFEETPLLKSQDSSGAKVTRIPQTSHARKEGSSTGLTSPTQNIQNFVVHSKGAQSQNIHTQVTRVHSQKTSIDETYIQSNQMTHSQGVQGQVSHVQTRHSQVVLSQRVKCQAAYSVSMQSQVPCGQSIKCPVTRSESTPSQTPHSQSVQSQLVHSQSIPSQASCMQSINSQATHSQSMRSHAARSQRVQDQVTESQSIHSQAIHSQNNQNQLPHAYGQTAQSQNINSQVGESKKVDIQTIDSKSMHSQVHHSENIHSQVAHNQNIRSLMGRSQNVRIPSAHNQIMNTVSMESHMEKQKIILKKVKSPEPVPVTKKNTAVAMADAMFKMPLNLLTSSRSTFVKDPGLIVKPDVHVSKETGYHLRKMSMEPTGGQGDAAPKGEETKVAECGVEASSTLDQQQMPSPKDAAKQEENNSFKNSALEVASAIPMPSKSAEQRASIVLPSGVSYADALKQKSQRIPTQLDSEQQASLNTSIGKIKAVDDTVTIEPMKPISRCPGKTDLTQTKEILCEHLKEIWIKDNSPIEHSASKHPRQPPQQSPTAIHQPSALKKTRPQLRARHMLHEACTLKHSKQEVSHMLLETDAHMKTKLLQSQHQLHEANANTQMQSKLQHSKCQLHEAGILMQDQLPEKEHQGLNEVNTQTEINVQQMAQQQSLDIKPVKTATQEPTHQVQCQECNVSTIQQSKLQQNPQHQLEPITNQTQEETQQAQLDPLPKESSSVQTEQQQNEFLLHNDNAFNQGTGLQKVHTVSQETESLILAKQQQVQQVQHELFQARLELDNIQTNIIQAKQQRVQAQKKLHEARTLTQSKQQHAQRKLHKDNAQMQEKAQQKSQEVQHWLQEVSALAESEEQQTQEHKFLETPSDDSFQRIASSISEPQASLLSVPVPEREDNQSKITPKISLPAGISLPQNSFTFSGNTPKFDWVGSQNVSDDHFQFKSPFPKVQEMKNVTDSPKQSQANESAQNSIPGAEPHSLLLNKTNTEILPDTNALANVQPSFSSSETHNEVPISLSMHTVAQDVDSETEVKYTPAEIETMFLSTFPAEELPSAVASGEVLTTEERLPLGDVIAEEADYSKDQLAPQTKPKLKVQSKLRAVPKALSQFPSQQKQTVNPTNLPTQEPPKPTYQAETKQQKKKKQKKEGDVIQDSLEKFAENQTDAPPSLSLTVVEQGAEMSAEKVRTSGRWPSFRVDNSCPKKCNRSLKTEKRLPGNVQKWLTTSKNSLMEPSWVSTLKLAGSLVAGTKFCLDYYDLHAVPSD